MKKYNNKLIKSWSESLKFDMYQYNEHRRPANYESNNEAIEVLKEKAELKRNQLKIDTGKKTLSLVEISDILIDVLSFVMVQTTDSTDDAATSLVIYNYDTKVYEFNTQILKTFIVAIQGYTTMKIIKDVITTIEGKSDQISIYNPLPKYKVAVGNGIYNCLTKELEPFTPEYTTLNKIKTNYNPDAKHPEFKDGFTYEKMLADFTNNDSNRLLLLHQILKAIVTGVNVKASLFIILGPGGGGKSTMFLAIADVIGRNNVGFVNFEDLKSPDKKLLMLNKKLVLGLDNNANIYIKDTRTIKSIASHETITYQRKYMPAIAIDFDGVFVQLCNEMPRFAESGPSMERRLITLHVENSYYVNSNVNNKVDLYMKNKDLQEYILKYILDLPYYADFNDVDRDLVHQTLSNEDSMGQFFDELFLTNFLAPYNKKIPLHILFAMYCDWIKTSNMQDVKYALRGFTHKIQNYIKDYGYVMSDSVEDIIDKSKPSTLIESNEFIEESLSTWSNGVYLQQALEDNKLYKYLYRDESLPIKPSKSMIRRLDYEISAPEFFKVDLIIDEFAFNHNLENEILITDDNINIEVNNQINEKVNKYIDIFSISSREEFEELINSNQQLDLIKIPLKQYIMNLGNATYLMHYNTIGEDYYKLTKLLNMIKDDLYSEVINNE